MSSSMNMSTSGGNSTATKTRSIGIVVFPGFAGLDVFGPLEFITMLSTTYSTNLSIIARTLDPVSTKAPQSHMMNGMMMDMSSGVGQSIVPTHTYATAPPLNVLFVPGGMGTRSIVNNDTDPELIAFLQDRANTSKLEYLISVCTGASLLAKAGALNGRRVTTNKFSYT
ncbi:hypothetical protein HDU93_006478, partial [Gonapodya sp. JEL0774]